MACVDVDVIRAAELPTAYRAVSKELSTTRVTKKQSGVILNINFCCHGNCVVH